MKSDLYSPEIAAEICDLLSQGKSLNAICKLPLMPSEGTVRAWARDDYEGFATKYAHARELGYLVWADQIVTIADDGTNDYPVVEDGSGVVWVSGKPDADHISRSKLRVDARKWLLSKVLPKIYGDKVSTEISGPEGKPIQIDDATAANKLAAIFNAVLATQPADDDASDLA